MSDDLEPADVMRERWKPKMVDAATALQTLGVSDLPADLVVAFRYPSVDAAEAFARANLIRNGLPTVGIVATADGGAIGVVDLRPQLVALQARRRGQ